MNPTYFQDHAIMCEHITYMYGFNTSFYCGVNQVFGLMTQPLIRFMLPTSSSAGSSDQNSPKSHTVSLLGHPQDSELDLEGHDSRPTSLRLLLTTPTHTVHRYWRKFDNTFMRPVFGGRGFVPYVPGSPTEGSRLMWMLVIWTQRERVVQKNDFRIRHGPRAFFFSLHFCMKCLV